MYFNKMHCTEPDLNFPVDEEKKSHFLSDQGTLLADTTAPINNPLDGYKPIREAMNFFYWRELFPELEEIFLRQDVILEEARRINTWVAWPEDHFSLQCSENNNNDWTVFPLLHTFPALDISKKTWISSTCSFCPQTTEMLRKLPNVRTALFSKLGPNTRLSSHTGWADLANHVLRVHFCLEIPEDNCCGLLVDGEMQYHKQGSILVFDDSKPHRAFNVHEEKDRTVLIIDLLRPSHIPTGSATGAHTPELDSFVALFR